MDLSPKKEIIKFLAEDIGKGDITSRLLSKKRIKVRIISRESGVVAGTSFAKQIFVLKKATVKITKKDGSKIKKNDVIMEITGTASSILTCERTALNLLSRMSGIATQTNNLTKKIQNHKVKVFATRKTAPGLRYFDKYAVKVGGGEPHRMTLNDMVMLKDNHLAAEGNFENIIKKAIKKHKKIEVEVETLKDAITAAKLGVSIIMLDNFTPSQITKTVTALKKQKLRGNVTLEASGGINSKNISKYAKTGVDMISVGSITNSVKAIDFSLEV